MAASSHSLPDINWSETTQSTNEDARNLFASGHRAPVWITAGEQTKGRGRLGREWVSRPGNLYASLLWPVTAEAEVLPNLSLVAGLAVRDAFANTGAEAALELKWPNDVLLASHKVSGVLIETVSSDDDMAAIIGCGLNLKHHPEDTRWPATNLAAHGVDISPSDMTALLADAAALRLNQWDNGSGLAGIRESWMDVAYGKGATVRTSDGIEGMFTGLQGNGALEITKPDGTTHLHHAGDVEWPSTGQA